MEVELGFQANCSELVTHLGFTKKVDIIKALTDIARITGWSWWIEISSQYLPVPTERLEELVSLLDGRMGVEGKKILQVWEKDLNEDSMAFINRTAKNDHLTRLKLVGDKEQAKLPGDPFQSSLTATTDCWCGKKELVIELSQHHQIEEMPAFHAIRMAFGSDFEAHDGGTVEEYMAWLAYHFFDKKLAIDGLTDGGTIEADEDIRMLKEYPPLDASKGLSKEDMDRLVIWLRFWIS